MGAALRVAPRQAEELIAGGEWEQENVCRVVGAVWGGWGQRSRPFGSDPTQNRSHFKRFSLPCEFLQ